MATNGGGYNVSSASSSSSNGPATINQQQLKDFVTKYRLKRAKLDNVVFYMNPDITVTNQWMVAMQPMGSGYVRWSYGAQPMTIQLQGTPGPIGYDSGSDTLGGLKQLVSQFAPWPGSAGNDNQLKTHKFSFPAVGLNTHSAYIDLFQYTITKQYPLYVFFTIQLTILPPKVAQDYATFTPPTPYPTTSTPSATNPNVSGIIGGGGRGAATQ